LGMDDPGSKVSGSAVAAAATPATTSNSQAPGWVIDIRERLFDGRLHKVTHAVVFDGAVCTFMVLPVEALAIKGFQLRPDKRLDQWRRESPDLFVINGTRRHLSIFCPFRVGCFANCFLEASRAKSML